MLTFPAVLRASWDDCPDRVAVWLMRSRQPDLAVTYRDLLRGAAGQAAALARAGIQPGEVAVIILQHGEALIHAFWGAVLRGAIPSILPFLTEKLSPDKYRQDLAALIGITQPAAVITYREFASEVEAAMRACPRNSVRAVLIGEDAAPVEPDFEALGGLRRAPDDIALLQHSSGSTGLQKGVALSHRAVFNQLDAYARAIRLSEDDVIASWLPLYHDMGLIACFVLPILRRVPVAMMSPFDWVRAPARLLQAVAAYRVTLAWLPNFAYNFCAQKIRPRDLQNPDGTPVDLSSLRAVTNCSEPIHWSSHQAFLERFRPHGFRAEALAVSYAMAENVFGVTQGGIDGPAAVDEVDERTLITQGVAVPAPAGAGAGAVKLASSGRPLSNTRVRVLDPQRRDLPERRVGELAILSDCMLTGYYRRDDLTAEAFHEGWFLTGDLGYLADGEVYVTGRKKDLIIVGGKNIAPQDLERLAGQAPGVHPGRVVAFGVYDEQAGTEEVVVVAESDAESEDERQRVADAIRAAVTRGSDVALRRARVVGPRWLLKTSSGKIARAANRDKYLAEEAGQA
jgi:acyl-CoA synthetase (AMP-forming)/AMP-acid ligase II